VGPVAVVMLALLLLPAPAPGATRQPLPQQIAAFAMPTPSGPLRDAVIEGANRPLARAVDSARTRRYAVGDAQASAVSIEVSAMCATLALLGGCDPAADPGGLAAFLGTLPHGPELDLLHVLMATQAEINNIRGASTLACYFPDLNRMVIRGNATPPSGGVSRDFVVAHEYGHHLGKHRATLHGTRSAGGRSAGRPSSESARAFRRAPTSPATRAPTISRTPARPSPRHSPSAAFPNETAWLWTDSLRVPEVDPTSASARYPSLEPPQRR
jgi:hypothetical protein